MKMTRAQKIYVAILGFLGLIWLGSQIAAAILEYSQGPSAEAVLVEKLGSVALAAIIACALFMLVLQRIGILPTVKNEALNAAFSQYRKSGVFRFRDIALWIIVALVLVFFFNLFQGDKPADQSGPLMNIFINVFPMVLLIGVWLIVMRRMMSQRKHDDDGNGG